MMMKRAWVLFVAVVFLQSCATLFNGRTQVIHLKTEQPCTVVHKTDTIMKNTEWGYLPVSRSPNVIRLYLLDDSLKKEVFIVPKSSFAFWANLSFNYGLGMLVDMNNPKRYTYPKNIYLGSFGADTTIRKGGIVMPPERREARHLLKISPQRMLNILQPGIELSYELRNSKNFSTQLTAAYMRPMGYRIALEEKYYPNKRAPFGTYFSFGLDYQRNQFKRVIRYVDESLVPDSMHQSYYIPDSLTYLDSVNVDRRIFNANLKIGYQWYRKDWCFDAYFGLGYRYRSVIYKDRINIEDYELGRKDFNFFDLLREGSYPVVNITLGFRIGYVFPYHKRTIAQDSFE